MNISLSKLSAIIAYFAQNTSPHYLGKTKLMKLFYYLDFLHTKKFGISVTKDRYVRLEKGPIPSTIMNLITELSLDPESSPLAKNILIEKPEGMRIHRIKSLKKFTKDDEDLFTKSELNVLADVVKRFGDEDTETVVEASHKEAPWLETKYGETIPYELAAHDPDSLYSEEEIRLLQEINK